MQRPNAALLAGFLALVVAVLSAATLAKGGFYLGKHEGDTLHLLEMVFREVDGQWPHLDFVTPIGVLATAPIAFFVWLGAGVGHAILYAQVLVALIALPAVWRVAASRFQGPWAYAFGALVMILLLALVHGEAQPGVSISMHYNRWAWAAAFIAIAAALMPENEGRPAPLVDGLIIGAALAAMALIKITYFGAFLIPIVAALIGRRAWPTLWTALATGLAVALSLTLLVGTPIYWLAYLRDLFTVMGSEVRPQPGLPLTGVVGSPAYMGGSIALLMGVIFLRQAGRALEGLVLLLLVPGFFYVTYQNFGNDPQWLWLLGLMLIALRPARDLNNGLGWNLRQGLLITGVVAIAFAAPSMINLAYSPFRHLAADTGVDDETGQPLFVPLLPGSGIHEDIQTARLRAQRVDAKIALDTEGAPYFAYADPELRDDAVEFAGETWPACSVELGMVAWFTAISDDLEASGLTEGHTVFTADILSSFWLYGAYAPLPGASPWYYGGLPGWDAAEFLLVPRCPLSTKVRKLILDAVAEEGSALTEVRRNEMYVLYAK
ncbi:MAG: hypothetical protein KDK10_16535 [Maritimibacter sp.]|nr:hypothetical protein [Maritimibacter sp.]